MEYEIWYMRPDWFQQGIFGAQPNLADLSATHIHLTNFVPSAEQDRGMGKDACEWIYWQMQGENWSPHGEARDLIISKGLRHTSMSVGDVIVRKEDGRAWVVAFAGFNELKIG